MGDKGAVLEQFIRYFRRETGGIWVCVEAATLDLPNGRVQVSEGQRFTIGMKYMNVELARILDEAHSRVSARRG